MNIKDWYEKNGAILVDSWQGPMLWIEKHDNNLTVVDTNTSAKELNYRDESNESAIKIIQQYNNLN